MSGDDALDEVLRALDLAAARGDARARHAAAYLRGGRSPGRPPIDDRELLREVEARRPAEGDGAIAAVARAHGSTALEIDAIERRLRRKIPRTK